MRTKKPSCRTNHQNDRIVPVGLVLLLIIASCFTVVTNTASAATYYVDAVNGNDSNPGTSGAPWKTIQRAELGKSGVTPVVAGGDTVYLRGGDYGQWMWPTVNNTSGLWVTYIAEDAVDDPPIFTRIFLNESSNTLKDGYLVFDGLWFEMTGLTQSELNSARAFGCWSLNHIKIKNCYFEAGLNWRTSDHTVVGACIYARGKPGGPPATDIEISNCTMTNSNDGIAAYMLSGSLFENNELYGLGNDAIVASDISNTVISGNYFHDMGVLGDSYVVDGNNTLNGTFQMGELVSQTNPTYGTVTATMKVKFDNYYFTEITDKSIPVGGFLAGYEISGATSHATMTPSHIATNSESYHSDDLQVYSTAGSVGTSDNITIRKNIFSSGNQGLLYEGTTKNDGLLVENNIWYGTFSANVCSIVGKTHSATIRNNTWCQDVTSKVSDLTIHSIESGSVYEIHNNLFSRAFVVSYGGSYVQTVNESHNICSDFIFTGTGAPAINATDYEYHNNVYPLTASEMNALFVDYANSNFQLKAGSRAINFGNPAYALSTDILGNPRDNQPDAGCYEYAPTNSFFAPISNKRVNEGSTLTFTVNVNDPNAEPFIEDHDLPSEPSFTNNIFSWTPTYNDAGSYEVTFVVQTGLFEDSETISIIVNNVNRAPVLAAISNKTVDENSLLSFSVSATDPDGDTITYSAEGLPSGATFTGQTFNWTPTYSQAGTYQVTFAATDGQTQNSRTVNLTVNNVSVSVADPDDDPGEITTVPSSPMSVSASDGGYTNKVRVTWNFVSGASGYEVWRNTSNNSGTAIKSGAYTSPHNDSSVTNGTTYYYWVKAKNSYGASGFSPSDSGYASSCDAPSAPTGVSASDGTYNDHIRVTWNSVSDATGYEVWRNTSNNSGTAIKSGDDYTSPYNDYGVTDGTTYYYWVNAKNSCGTSDFNSSDPGYTSTNPNSSVSITKCAVTAGRKDNSDKISFSGTMGANTDDFDDADTIEVTIDSNDIVNLCVLNFPIDANTFKKDKYSYSRTDGGIKKSFKYDVKTGKFSFAAGNIDLSGLGCPVSVGVEIGDYIGAAEVNETVVNGPKRPIPILLMMGVKNVMRVNKFTVKQNDKKPNGDQLSVKGAFAVEDTDVNMVNEEFVVTLDSQTFALPAGSFNAGKRTFSCLKADTNEGGTAAAPFNFNSCAFTLTIKDANIPAISGAIDFGMAFANFNEIEQVTLP